MKQKDTMEDTKEGIRRRKLDRYMQQEIKIKKQTQANLSYPNTSINKFKPNKFLRSPTWRKRRATQS